MSGRYGMQMKPFLYLFFYFLLSVFFFPFLFNFGFVSFHFAVSQPFISFLQLHVCIRFLPVLICLHLFLCFICNIFLFPFTALHFSRTWHNPACDNLRVWRRNEGQEETEARTQNNTFICVYVSCVTPISMPLICISHTCLFPFEGSISFLVNLFLKSLEGAEPRSYIFFSLHISQLPWW